MSLITTPIEWGFWSDKNKKRKMWGASAFLADAEIEEGTGKLSFSISNKLKNRLLVPEMFAYLNMEIQKSLSTGYQLNLYENCVRYRGLGFTPWWPLEVFRSLMNVPSGTYTEFKKLNAKVIKTAQKGINNISDIIVEPEFKKKGRRIAEIRFIIKDNPQMPLWAISTKNPLKEVKKVLQTPEQKEFFESMLKYKIKPSSIVENIINNHGLETAIIIRDYGERNIKEKKVEVEKWGGYMAECLRHQYGINESNKVQEEMKKRETQKQYGLVKEKEKIEKQVEKERKNKEWREQITKRYEELSKKQNQDFLNEFEKKLTGYNLKTYKEKGLDSPLIKGIFRSTFLSKKFNMPIPKEIK